MELGGTGWASSVRREERGGKDGGRGSGRHGQRRISIPIRCSLEEVRREALWMVQGGARLPERGGCRRSRRAEEEGKVVLPREGEVSLRAAQDLHTRARRLTS